MSAFVNYNVSLFASDVSDGLSLSPKQIASRHLYDEIGVGLFQIVTRLPEFGIARAEERLLRRHSSDLVGRLDQLSLVGEVGIEGDRPTALLLRTLAAAQPRLHFRFCDSYLQPLRNPGQRPHSAESSAPIYSDWLAQAWQMSSARPDARPVLLTLPGNLIGTLDPTSLSTFLDQLRSILKPGDYFLFSADLVKEPGKLTSAYDDPAGIVSAFNKNLLSRINRELGGHFRLSHFQHTVKWNAFQHLVELHLTATEDQQVFVSALGRRFQFKAGETILTDSAYKFSELELEQLALRVGFLPVKHWIDIEWPFAQILWSV